jgi:hypothetical protein
VVSWGDVLVQTGCVGAKAVTLHKAQLQYVLDSCAAKLKVRRDSSVSVLV